MGSVRQLRYYRGVLIPFLIYTIAEKYNIPEADINMKEDGDLMNENLKAALGVEHVSTLSTSETEDYLLEIRVFIEESYGVIAPIPDPHGINPKILERMDMSDFLAYYKNKP